MGWQSRASAPAWRYRPAAPPKRAKITSCIQLELLFFQILPVIFFQVCSWDLHLLLSHLAFVPQPAPCSLDRPVGRQGRSPFPTSPPTVMARARSSTGDAGTAQHSTEVGMPGFPSLCDGSTWAEPSHPLNLNAQPENKGKSTGKWALLTGHWETGSRDARVRRTLVPCQR